MNNFNTLQLRDEILRAVTDLGFVSPTPVQAEAIPFLLNNKQDMIALAQTGTGKTAAFSLPVLQQIDTENPTIQMLVLCPTRELCLQIHGDILSFSKYMNGIRPVAVYGGTAIDKQIREVRNKANIIVGTPGRTLDLIMRKVLKLESVLWLVLDEADEMLSMGFEEDMKEILKTTPEEKQVMLFSATMPPAIRNIAKNYMTRPYEISVGKSNTGNADIEHQYFLVQSRDKYTALKRVADINPDIYAIVFCRTKMETKEVADKLGQDGYNADALHGDLSQSQRDYVMGRFRKGQLQILVATDVAARGLDVNELTHVINYTIPDDPATYIHRSGRTGRAGNKGISLSIIHGREVGKLREIEKRTGKSFSHISVPTGNEICEIQLMHMVNKMINVELAEDQINPYLPAIFDLLSDMTKEEVIKRFVSLEFNRFLEYYKNAVDINLKKDKDRDKRERGGKERGGSDNSDMTRMKISIGYSKGATPRNLLGLINEHLMDANVEIGRIDIKNDFSLFDVTSDAKNRILDAFKDTPYRNLTVSVDRRGPSRGNSSTSGKSSRGDNGGARFDRKKKSKKYRF
jgi:ATP-dependent RNA helicase DeaD